MRNWALFSKKNRKWCPLPKKTIMVKGTKYLPATKTREVQLIAPSPIFHNHLCSAHLIYQYVSQCMSNTVHMHVSSEMNSCNIKINITYNHNSRILSQLLTRVVVIDVTIRERISYTGWPRSYHKYILQITQPSQYRYAKLHYSFAVTSGSPSIWYFYQA